MLLISSMCVSPKSWCMTWEHCGVIRGKLKWLDRTGEKNWGPGRWGMCFAVVLKGGLSRWYQGRKRGCWYYATRLTILLYFLHCISCGFKEGLDRCSV